VTTQTDVAKRLPTFFYFFFSLNHPIILLFFLFFFRRHLLSSSPLTTSFPPSSSSLVLRPPSFVFSAQSGLIPSGHQVIFCLRLDLRKVKVTSWKCKALWGRLHVRFCVRFRVRFPDKDGLLLNLGSIFFNKCVYISCNWCMIEKIKPNPFVCKTCEESYGDSYDESDTCRRPLTTTCMNIIPVAICTNHMHQRAQSVFFSSLHITTNVVVFLHCTGAAAAHLRRRGRRRRHRRCTHFHFLQHLLVYICHGPGLIYSDTAQSGVIKKGSNQRAQLCISMRHSFF
jgi:hypothetical protein